MSVLSINWLDINTEYWNLSIRHQGHQESRQRIFFGLRNKHLTRKKEATEISSKRKEECLQKGALGLAVDVKKISSPVSGSLKFQFTGGDTLGFLALVSSLRRAQEPIRGRCSGHVIGINQSEDGFWKTMNFSRTLWSLSRGWWHFSRRISLYIL